MDFVASHRGEIAAVAVSLSWAWGSQLFTAAARRVGSHAVNFARLLLATALLGLTHLLASGRVWPAGVDAAAHGWLVASGVVGLALGDAFLFHAFATIGPRRSMLAYSTSPLFTAVAAYLLLDERLGPLALAGMALILAGVGLAAARRDEGGGPFRSPPRAVLRRGLLYGLAGAACQGLGAAFAKLGMAALDPLPATLVRMAWAALAMLAVTAARGEVAARLGSFRDRRALAPLLGAVVLGPFLGVWGSLFAFKHADAGVAAALIGTVPVTVLLPSWVVFRDRPSAGALAGAVLAVAGGAVLFLR